MARQDWRAGLWDSQNRLRPGLGCWGNMALQNKVQFEFRAFVYSSWTKDVTTECRASSSSEKLVYATAPMQPTLKWPTFSGKLSEDKFACKNFLAQFENFVVGVKTKND